MVTACVLNDLPYSLRNGYDWRQASNSNDQKFRMLVPTMIGAAPALEKLGGRVPSCRFRALRPFHQYTLLA